jgi:IS5 family transposase
VVKDSGLVQRAKVIAANVSGVAMMPKLPVGKEEIVYGNSGYLDAQKREDVIVNNKKIRRFSIKSIAVHRRL